MATQTNGVSFAFTGARARATTRTGGRRFQVARAGAKSSSDARAVIGEMSAVKRDAKALAPGRAENYAAHRESANGDFITPEFAHYALCGTGVLLGSSLSAVLLSLIPTLRSARRTLDEVAYLAASVREEVPDTLAAVRVSGLELTDVMEEVGELTADVGGGIRSAGRGVTATVNTAQAVGRYAAAAIPEIRRRAKPIAGTVKNETIKVLEERAEMEPYSGTIINSTANKAKKGVAAARSALKSAGVARNVGKLYKTIRSPPAKDIKP